MTKYIVPLSFSVVAGLLYGFGLLDADTAQMVLAAAGASWAWPIVSKARDLLPNDKSKGGEVK